MSRLKINDISLHYEVYGNSNSNNTVFLLNGVMASTSSWMTFVQPLEKLGFQVVLHDFMGQLKSDKPQGPYQFKSHEQHILALANHLGKSKFHVIGTSYGSEVGMKLAIDYPEYVQSLTIIDGVSEIDEVMKNFVLSWRAMCDYDDPYQFFWGMAPSIYGNDFLKTHHEYLEERAIAMRKVDRSYFEGQKILYDTFLSEVNFTSSLHKIECPTLIVVGEDDLLKPTKFSRKMATSIRNNEFYVLPNCGHVTIFEKPQELITLTTGFLKKHTEN